MGATVRVWVPRARAVGAAARAVGASAWPRCGIVAVLVLVGCTSSAGAGGADQAELRILAAASLTDVMADLEQRWLTSHPGHPLALAFDASNVLAAQVAAGAPADVFVSADVQRPAQLVEAGLAVGRPVAFARTRLAVAVPVESRAVTTATDLARPGLRLVAAGDGVPITGYAEAALSQLAATTDDPTGFLDRVRANVVSREDNVRAGLAKVELGEADAMIVYQTDVATSDLVRGIPFPKAVDVTAEYASVQLSERPGTSDFVAWLAGPEAGAVLAAHGFEANEG